MKTQHGFTLIEILISLFILSIVLLSLADLELNARAVTKQSYYRLVAINAFENAQSRYAMSSSTKFLTTWKRQLDKQLPRLTVDLNQSSLNVCWFYQRLHCLQGSL